MNKQYVIMAGALVFVLALGLAGGYWLAGSHSEKMMAEGERKVLFYRNPMNPAITSPVFMKDEMGMDYIAVFADDGGNSNEPAGTVRIDPVAVQNIGVRIARAEKRSLSRSLRAVGRVAYNEERLAKLYPKTEGWVEELYVGKTGEKVKKGMPLLNIYSPQLVTSQQEYLLALDNWEALKESPFEDIRQSAEALMQSARERLELLDVPAHQLRELERDHKVKKYMHIHSPFDGTVIKMGVREGQHVTARTELYSLADLSKVWAFVDIYEDQLPWVKEGDKAEMRVRAIPGRVFKGQVSYIYPYMESKTRTVQLRLEFDNRDMSLKPEMFANITLQANRQAEAVVVPSEAIIRSGTREQVFVVRGPGKFEPREVKVGISTEGMTQILEGVNAGEEVVTSSQFLIDSESKLREATAKMMAVQKIDPQVDADMQMDDMGMNDMDMSGMGMDDTQGGASVTGDDVHGSTNAAGAGSAGAARTSGVTDMTTNEEANHEHHH
ncbi:MAG: efflux RND transporter periplasmic adaptor subunit [Gammaproteobacteria bacterium]|nr:efflux RND transporter periplasmic adaptor subunit [Gammaproteobacteria bacterium]